MRHHRKLAAGLVAAVLLPTAAQAATPSIYVWQGRTKAKHDFTMYRVKGQKRVQVRLSVQCKNPDGQQAPFEFTADPKANGNKLKFTQKKAYNGVAGTLSVNAKIKPGEKSTGKVSWKLPAEYATDCAAKDSFKLKFAISHGG